MNEFEFTDRYDALGIPPPDLKTMCEGQCEGTGFMPIYNAVGDNRKKKKSCHVDSEKNPILLKLWQEAENAEPADDGWHFVKCSDCDGGGKKS